LEKVLSTSNIDYKRESFNGRIEVIYVNGSMKKSTFAEDVRIGLTAEKKFLLPKYFYDETGSGLFEKICTTNEYYVTRTETDLLYEYSDEIASMNQNIKYLVELGSGSSVKTRLIIDSFLKQKNMLHYLPIDVSEIMIDSSLTLTGEKSGLRISGFISEYEEGISLIHELYDESKLIIFFGSSIGNFDPHHAKRFVKFIGSNMSSKDSLLIGFDMKKDTGILNAAYNDKSGYTSKFNLNLLCRINNELGGDFDLNLFEHHAYFNEEESRIEMRLVSLQDHEVTIGAINEIIKFRKGESIYTESSYKFTDKMIEEIAMYSYLKLTNIWRDEKNYFSLCLFRPW
jgi:dimethylhistidine N-methyltransferase